MNDSHDIHENLFRKIDKWYKENHWCKNFNSW